MKVKNTELISHFLRIVWFCQAPQNQYFSSPTPTRCPMIQFDPDTSYLKLIQTHRSRAQSRKTALSSDASCSRVPRDTSLLPNCLTSLGVPKTPYSGSVIHRSDSWNAGEHSWLVVYYREYTGEQPSGSIRGVMQGFQALFRVRHPPGTAMCSPMQKLPKPRSLEVSMAVSMSGLNGLSHWPLVL